MSISYNINRNSNIEIESDVIRFRVPLTEYNTDEIDIIEKDIKKKAQKVTQNPNYLSPFQVEIINSSVIYYYDVKNLQSFLSLRDLAFEDKLKYYRSLVSIAKNEDTNVAWDKHNFVIDPYQENVMAVVYETDLIRFHDEVSPLDKVKELILISLTNLDSIMTIPSRSSFIDKDQYVIQFAETLLLKINNLDDLENFIETKIIEFDMSIEQDENISEEKNSRKEKRRKTTKIQHKGKKSRNINIGNLKLEPKKIVLYGGIAFLLIFGIILNMGSNDSSQASDSETEEENDNQDNDTIITDIKNNAENETINVDNVDPTDYDDELLLAYRYSLTDNKEQAIKVMEKIGFENLPEQDKAIMLNIYEQLRMYEQVIELYPSRAENIVNNLLADNNTERIHTINESIKTNNPYIEFEVAYLNGESEKVINLKDKVELNGRKEKQIMESYLKLEMKDEARDFAQEVGNPDLIQMAK